MGGVNYTVCDNIFIFVSKTFIYIFLVMAETKISFAIFNPGSGNGDVAVSISAEKHTGRVARTMSAKVATNDNGIEKDFTINQAATPEFVTIDETASVAKTGGTVTINGTSNSTKLTFSLTPDGTNPLTLTLPENYTAAGKDTANDAAIADDPGATAEYNFSITFSGIPENATIASLINTLKVVDNAGNEDSTVITQAAGDAALEIDKDVINLDVDGTAQTLNVSSNTNWTISEVVAKILRMGRK